MNLWQIVLLAAVQGLAELLPVSSSAHVILAEKMMGLDPTSPKMTLLLLMLHTGTMFAVLVYFWGDWKQAYFQTRSRAVAFGKQVVLATGATGVLGLALKELIEKVVMRSTPHAQVEMLFGNLTLISISLACGGVLILYAAAREKRASSSGRPLGARESLWIGLVQGLCLPFRGFSRSGATISTGLILGLSKIKSEDFSFALALVVTPPLLLKEILRLLKAHAFAGYGLGRTMGLFVPGLLGMVFSFIAGLLALRWLSSWLARGRWGWFGLYCLAASVLVWIRR